MEEYKKRIVKAIRYIDDHLDAELTLERISEIAAYSPFHFHRIFRWVTGETLQNHIIRRRIEKSAFYLALKKNISIKNITGPLLPHSESQLLTAFIKFPGNMARTDKPLRFSTNIFVR
jgi:AraC family transcriptional regulator